MFANLLGAAVQPGPRRRTRRVQRGVAPLQRIVYAVRNPGSQVVGICTARQYRVRRMFGACLRLQAWRAAD